VIESKAKPASKTLLRAESEAADDFSNAAGKFAGKPQTSEMPQINLMKNQIQADFDKLRNSVENDIMTDFNNLKQMFA
jgi:hypothetical protein